jgi:predicted DNA-binding transcriptional regulator YafY
MPIFNALQLYKPMKNEITNPTNRLLLGRLIAILALLEQNAFPTCKTLAKLNEVSRKTSQRDIDELRALNYDILYDSVNGGFYLADHPLRGDILRQLHERIVKAWLNSSGENTACVRLRGCRVQQYLVRPDIKHESVKELSSNEIEIKIRYIDHTALVNWVLGCGHAALVLWPESLVQAVHDEATTLAQLHRPRAA